MWGDLALTIRQAAALTGVSPRQIQHWLDRGHLPISVKGNRRISGNALDIIVLIHQARLAGIPLRRAVVMAREYLSGLDADPLSRLDIGRQTLADIEEKLKAATTAIETVREVIERLEDSAPTGTSTPTHTG